MKKLKVQQSFTIEGTVFIVDIDKQALREFQQPDNQISFISDMTDLDSHYRLLYDPARKNIPQGTYDPQQMKEIQVPQLLELNPLGMASKYGLQPEDLKGKTDFQVIVNQEALELRHKGALPKLDIMGEKFYVDLRMQELRHAENFHPILSLRSFELTGDGWHYEAFYEPLMKQLVEMDPKLTEIPHGVARIKIPNEIGLDPVATARTYGMNERELLRRYPIQPDLKAEVISLFDTYLPALVQRNKQELTDEHQANARKARPHFRHRF